MPPGPFEERRRKVQQLRDQCSTELKGNVPGCTIAANYCASLESLLLEFLSEVAVAGNYSLEALAREGAILAVGGTGRGELAPFSDVDLLILSNKTGSQFEELGGQFLTYLNDALLKPGAAIREFNEAIAFAQQDPQGATALVEARHFWGNAQMSQKLISTYKSRVVESNRRKFIEDCLAARQLTDDNSVPMAQELQPDVKSSIGGLRDMHLIRWIGFARYGVADIESLRLRGALSRNDARAVRDAWEFLTRIRVDLHLAAKKPQDRLTRDEQRRISEDWGYKQAGSQRPVERFMQEYFNLTLELASITRRFAAVQRPVSIFSHAKHFLVAHSTDGIFHVGPDRVEVPRRHLGKLTSSLEMTLKLFRTAALYGVPPAPQILEAIKEAVPQLSDVVTSEAGKIFLDIMRCTKPLGMVLRSMVACGVLDKVIPDYTHIRNLLQFNQYHHFTVDEHTLRAIETVTSFENDDGPIGSAYNAINSKEVLHLAVLLHDIGKGFERDHSELGMEIGGRIAQRLGMSVDQREQIEILVLKHLVMADNAWRKDITDPKLLYNFSKEIGSANVLRMLYVLTAADVTSVGPGTWTSWKGNLLAEFYDRCMVILSGKHYSYHEQQRLKAVKEAVGAILKAQPKGIGSDSQEFFVPLEPTWIDHQLEGCSAYYLTCTPPDQIAADLRTIAGLTDEAIEVRAHWDEETRTLEYRVITRNPIATTGCFHKMAGVLTAKRHEILSADINTTIEGVVVDSYRVRDRDYQGPPPDERIEDVADGLRQILKGKLTVGELFKRGRRFGKLGKRPESELKTRVRVDNNSSDSRTIIEVFAKDHSGLLYVIARTIHELNLSVDLAKIATHFDQVMDVFYVQERETGEKVTGDERLQLIKQTLTDVLNEFEEDGYKEYSR